MKKITDQISNTVENACKQKESILGRSVWTHHIIFVVKYSKELAKKLNADIQVVEIAALLHDYAGIKDEKLWPDHHIHGAKEAEKILKEFNYPPEKIKMVKE